MSDIKMIKTDDGSLGLYDADLDEIFHSKTGAKKEAYEKFIEPCFVLGKSKPLKILDICYGVGFNTKCALEYLENIDFIDCVEINPELVLLSADFDYCDKINKIIKDNFENPGFINFYIGDARKIIPNLNKKYDVIFHDGFAPYKQCELWSENFIFEITKLMNKNSLYCTYNHSKPVLNALFQNNLTVGKIIKENRTIATCASFSEDLIENKVNDFEIKQLMTKSAITYKDPNLNLPHKKIFDNRKVEMKNSALPTLSSFKKHFLNSK